MDEAFDEYNKNKTSKTDKTNVGCLIAHLNHYTEDYSGSGHLYLVRLLGKGREDANKVIEQMAERGDCWLKPVSGFKRVEVSSFKVHVSS